MIRSVLLPLTLAALGLAMPISSQAQGVRYVRYDHAGVIGHGIIDGATIRVLSGDFLDSPAETGATVPLDEVRLLAPVEPGKVIAVGLNYLSHLGGAQPADYPGLFLKLPSSIVGPDAEIVMPPDAADVHYEGELVLVIGREATGVAAAEAGDYVFGVTAGNDVSERGWQRADLQWFRAKASDTFGPIGPAVAAGLDYDDLLVQTRLNGETMQSESTADLIFGIDEIVSYVSRYVTLMPGDLIFTGTPGTTSAMSEGDVVEVEVAGVGVLRNRVVRRR